MPTLTPNHRNEEVTNAAMQEGITNGILAFVPCLGALYMGMQNPNFVKVTNWQSRTAMVVMPSLFIFSISGEMKLAHRMKEVSRETEHSHAAVHWAEEEVQNLQNQQRQQIQKRFTSMSATQQHEQLAAITQQQQQSQQQQQREEPEQIQMTEEETEKQLMELYRRSISESGLNIVPGDTLGIHHRIANYISENPFKLLSAIAIPSVFYIFYGRSNKSHLQLSMKIMHTRVFGQFATISLLLGIMGFKEYMDSNGKYITEAEAEARVNEMKYMRQQLQQQLQYKRQQRLKFEEELKLAHEQDIKAGNGDNEKVSNVHNNIMVNADNVVIKNNKKRKKMKKKKKKQQQQQPVEVVVEEENEVTVGVEEEKE